MNTVHIDATSAQLPTSLNVASSITLERNREKVKLLDASSYFNISLIYLISNE